jgi:hypothetical protein
MGGASISHNGTKKPIPYWLKTSNERAHLNILDGDTRKTFYMDVLENYFEDVK